MHCRMQLIEAGLRDPIFAVIVGAGLSGATVAERIATQLKRRVLVVDSRSHIGGNVFDKVMGDSGLLESQYGAHLFHTINNEVWAYVQRFAEWVPWEHKVIGLVTRADGGQVHVPIAANIATVNALFDARIQTEEEMKAFMAKERAGQPADADCANSEQAGKARVGPRIFDALFRDYTRKQWGVGAEALDASVLRHIPVRENFDDRYFGDKFQALPRKGYTAMVGAHAGQSPHNSSPRH
jgi:UDP-galactopyranose mutase